MTESFTLSLFVYPNFLCTVCVTVASWLFVPWKRCGRGVCHAPRRYTPTLCRYESWPPYLYACCFSGESFIHGSHLMFSWRLSFNGQSHGCRYQKFAIAGKTVDSQSRGGFTPARSLNTPRWVITRVLPGTNRRIFVIITGVVPGYK